MFQLKLAKTSLKIVTAWLLVTLNITYKFLDIDLCTYWTSVVLAVLFIVYIRCLASILTNENNWKQEDSYIMQSCVYIMEKLSLSRAVSFSWLISSKEVTQNTNGNHKRKTVRASGETAWSRLYFLILAFAVLTVFFSWSWTGEADIN